MGACGKGFANCRWVTSSSIYTRVQLLPDPRCLEFLWMESLTQESWTDSTEFSRILFKNCHGRSEFRFHLFFLRRTRTKKSSKARKAAKASLPLAGEVTTDDVDRFSESVALWLQFTKNLSIQ